MVKNLISGAAIASLLFVTVGCSSSQHTANAPNQPSDQRGQAPSTEQIMKDLDSNNDGKISKSEAKGPLAMTLVKLMQTMTATFPKKN